MKIVTVIGARPQFIKAATVSRAINKYNKSCHTKNKIKEIIVHTGQHYDENMSQVFFDELQIPRPDFNLGVGSDSHGRQTGQMLAQIEDVLVGEKPDFVITYGDTNSTLAGALAASKLHILTAHVEAGLRSYNRKMPEEINRIVTDEISNILFCPTSSAVANLSLEGINTNKNPTKKTNHFNSQFVFEVGDVMYDSIIFNKKLAQKRFEIFSHIGILPNNYCLATLHRAENTDQPENLRKILKAFNDIASSSLKIVLPLHPRTKKCIEYLDLKTNFSTSLILTDPVGYLDMINLEKNAFAIFTDSGGVQKEAYFLNIPCITLRDETEWVETVQTGWNKLTGANSKNIIEAFSMLADLSGAKPPFPNTNKIQIQGESKLIQTDFHIVKEQSHPYGNGNAAEKIVDIFLKFKDSSVDNE